MEEMPYWEEMEWKCFRNIRGTEPRITDRGAKKFFAVYRNPKQFVCAALTCKHPIDCAFPLPDQLLRAVANVVNDGPKLTDLKRKLMSKRCPSEWSSFVTKNSNCTNCLILKSKWF